MKPSRLPSVALSHLAVLVLPPVLPAQDSSWHRIGENKPYGYVCPPVTNHSAQTLPVAEHVVRFENASYLQLELADYALGRGSWIEVRALGDGEVELLTAAILDRQRGFTAFFNGEAVRLRLYAGPRTTNRFRVRSVAVGLARPHGPLSICGSDDRTPSKDKRVARVVLNGSFCRCSAFLISSQNCFATAGHCYGNLSILNMLVEFNVPLSDKDGNCQHPPVTDQYHWKGSNKVLWKEDGLGDDWAVFLTEKNSMTNKHAGQAQGAWFQFGQVPAVNSSVRVTGYGLDLAPDPTQNQIQQTNAGPLIEHDGTVLRYRVDTKNYNSGSPVMDAQSDRVIAIHTTGGCKPDSDSNKGTWIWHPDFLDACDQLCSPPDFGNFDDFTLPPGQGGGGCRGTGKGECTVAFGRNAGAGPIDLLDSRGPSGLEFLLEAKAGQKVKVCGFELLTKATRTTLLPTGLYLADRSGGPGTQPVRTGQMPVGTSAAWTRVSFQPLEIALGTKFFLGFRNPSPSITLPACRLGSLGSHYLRTATGMTGPHTDVPWAYRVLAGEPGSPAAPVLGNWGVPTAGYSFEVRLSQAPPGAAAVLIQGFSNKQWGPLPLPFPVKDFGAPDCFLGASMDITFVTASDRRGHAAIRLAMPRIRGIGGRHLYYQWLVFDPLANRLGLTFSGGGDGRIGN